MKYTKEEKDIILKNIRQTEARVMSKIESRMKEINESEDPESF